VANDTLTNLRKGSSTNIVKVGFKEEVTRSLLQELPAVRSIHSNDPNNWQLATDDPELLRKQILELALRHNLNIVSLQSEDQSLEEVFRNLTNPVNN
jgi:ABC-2 type transport system ATP-binding protein